MKQNQKAEQGRSDTSGQNIVPCKLRIFPKMKLFVGNGKQSLTNVTGDIIKLAGIL
jgi:hypothetical protein